jgi:type I restriction enzyme, S subunit
VSELWKLPATWCWIPIGDVTDVIGGGTPSTSNPKNFNGSIPWITPADMSGYLEKSIAGGIRFISEKGLEDSGARWLPQGTVLFSSRAPIGYVAIASRPVTTNQGFKSFVPANGLNSDYLYYWLTSAKQHAEALASGTTFLELSGAKAAMIPLPLAPACEQARIVAKLEELLSDLDAGVDELKAAQKKLAQYRQSLLKAAVEGTLTAEWRTKNTPTETGAQLLQRILTERRARWEVKQLAKYKEQGKAPPKDWHKKYPEPVKPNTNDLPELPQGWVWASVEQLTEFITSGSRGWADYYADTGATFIRSQNINKDFLDLSDIAFVNPPNTSEGTRTRVQKDDVLLTITGANVGKAAHVDKGLAEAYVSQHVALIRSIDKDFAKFLHLFLTAEAGGRGQLNKEAYGAGKPGLNLQQVAAVCVPISSATECESLLKLLRIQFEAATAKDVALKVALKQATAQRQNILRAAFSGQLVPQDPSDEPASQLLSRIRAERTEREAIKKPRGRQARAL